MKCSLSKSIISLICVFLSVQILLTGAVYLLAKFKQHREMEAWIKTPEAKKYLKKLVFEKSELKKLSWHEENEFEWQGEFYDVSEKIEKKDTVIIYCFNDKKDSDLEKAFEQHQKKSEKREVKGLKLLTFYSVNEKVKFILNEIDLKTQLHTWAVFLPAPLIAVASPPPELI